jgi:hypothetical protein
VGSDWRTTACATPVTERGPTGQGYTSGVEGIRPAVGRATGGPEAWLVKDSPRGISRFAELE